MAGENRFLDSKKFKVIALTIGQGFNSVIIIVIGMVMARLLEKQEVAAYQQTFLAYRTVAPFLALGIGNGIYYFLPAEKIRIKGRVVDSIVVLGGMGLLFSVIVALGGNELLAKRFDNPKVAQQVLWMIPYALFMVPASHHAAVLVAQGRAALSAVYSTVIQLIVGICTIVPLIIWHDEECALIGNVIASCVTAACAIVLMIRVSPDGPASPSAKAMRELVAYSFPLGLATMMATVAMSLDKILVSLYLGPETFAVYSFGAREIPLIGLLMGSITSVIVVQMRQNVSNGNHKAAVNEFRKCAVLTAPLLFPIAGFFIVNSQSFITLLYTEKYEAAAIPFAIYSITVLVRVTTFGPLLTAYGQNWFILKRAIIGLTLNLILSIIGIRYFGSSGAAWATVITVFLVAVPMNYFKLSQLSGARIADFIPYRHLAYVGLSTLAITVLFLLVRSYCGDFALWVNAGILTVAVTAMNREIIQKTFFQIRNNF